jgi:hypothetical protein
MSSLLDTDFVQAEDRPMLEAVCAMPLQKQWGSHTQQLVDCDTFYSLVLDEIGGPEITAPACQSDIDLRLAADIVERFPRRLRDFRLVWKEVDMRCEIDLYKHSAPDDLVFPAVEWLVHDETIFEEQLDKKGARFQELPPFYLEMIPCLEALVKTIYNVREHHPVYHVTLGVEKKRETCYLLISNMDTISYAVLERLGEQAHIVDINVRASEKRLDIRVKKGKSTPFPLRSLAPKKHLTEDNEDKNERGAKRRRV